MTNDEIIQQAGTEWNKLRGTMKDYLATVIRIAREDERKVIMEKNAPEIEKANAYIRKLEVRDKNGTSTTG